MNTSGHVVYVDGSSVAMTYTTGSSSTQAWFNTISNSDTVRIGSVVLQSTEYFAFDGKIDDFRYYDDVLTSDEVTWLANNGSSGDDPTEDNLILHYDFDRGTISRDYSTITAWEADINNTTYSSAGTDIIGEMYNDSDFDETVTINANATNVDNITLTVPQIDRHDGTAGSGTRLKTAGGS